VSAAAATPEVRLAGPADAATVHALTQAAFAGYATLDPPSGALRETVDVVAAELAEHPGVVVAVAGEPVACARMDVRDGVLWLRRIAVAPQQQGRGYCRALVEWCERWAAAEGHDVLHLGVRDQVPANRSLYEHLGYTLVATHPIHDVSTWSELAKPLRAQTAAR
jgi:tRNA threonylcarbamoyladenosine biosynthesis protein TsaE